MCQHSSRKSCIDKLMICKNTFRVITIIINVFICLIGFGIVVLSAIILCSDILHDLLNTMDRFLNVRQCLGGLIIVGIVLVLIGLYSVLILTKFCFRQLPISMVLYLSVIITLGAILFHTWSDKQINMKSRISLAIRKYDSKNLESYYLDQMQKSLECCGFENASDYSLLNQFFNESYAPFSCCNETSKSILKCSVKETTIHISRSYTNSCADQLNFVVWNIILGILIGLCGMLALTIIIMGFVFIVIESARCQSSDNSSMLDADVDKKSENEDEDDEAKDPEADNEEANESENENGDDNRSPA